MKVLIADDSSFIRQKLESFFKKHKCSLGFAKDGEEALTLFEQSKFDLIVMDIVMPNVSGTEAVKKIRKSNADIPILALSNMSQGETINQMMEAGASTIIQKPLNEDKLTQAFEEYKKS